MGVTDNPHDGCLHEIDENGMQKCYLILPDGQRKDLVRPLRLSYIHETCGTETRMGQKIAETYAADPLFYGGTYCVHCKNHFPVGVNGEFKWSSDGTKVGS